MAAPSETSDGMQELVRLFPFLTNVSSTVLEELEGLGQRIRLSDGQAICSEGDRCTHLALVLSGGARVYKIGESGREITLYRVEPGESCILTASCILSDLEFPAHAAAEGDTVALVVPSVAIRRFLNEDESWRRYLFELLSRRLATVIAVLEEVAFGRLYTRLAEHLVATARPEPSPAVRETHEAIAAELGSSREVVSRLLKDLERDGVVQLGRGVVEIRDPEALQARAKIERPR